MNPDSNRPPCARISKILTADVPAFSQPHASTVQAGNLPKGKEDAVDRDIDSDGFDDEESEANSDANGKTAGNSAGDGLVAHDGVENDDVMIHQAQRI